MSSPVDGARSLLHRGWLVLVVMILLALLAVGTAYQRNRDTERLTAENHRLNAENMRLNGCVRSLIKTIEERAPYTQRLDDQAAADRRATRDFWTGIASATTPAARRAIFDKYRVDTDKIEAKRQAILTERDAHQFPSLAECQ